ncbi:MAG: hypothetical protein E4H44_02005, partial [Candidatus Aminicenantes bacterium]
MRSSRIRLNYYLAMTLAVGVAFGLAQGVFAQDEPLEFTQSGDAIPGGSVMVTVATTDGSTISSVAWSQTYGAPAALSGATTATVTAMLGAESAYRAQLIEVLEEPPIGPDELPPNVPPPAEEFFGGLQNRWQVVGASPFSLEEGGLVELHVMVTTTSGSYEADYAVPTTLRWKVSTGLSNIPTNIPVLLHGKTQASYDWALTAPGGSSAALVDATSQSPDFT